MLNRELFWSLGTMSNVLAGCCTGWTSCACVDAFASCLNDVWNALVDDLPVCMKGSSIHPQWDMALSWQWWSVPVYFVPVVGAHGVLGWVLVVAHSFHGLLFHWDFCLSGEQGPIVLLSIMSLFYFKLYSLVTVGTVSCWPHTPSFLCLPSLFTLVLHLFMYHCGCLSLLALSKWQLLLCCFIFALQCLHHQSCISMGCCWAVPMLSFL